MGLALLLGTFASLVALTVPAAGETAGKGEVLAELDGQTITGEEVEKAIGAPLRKLEEQIYTLKRRKLAALISERLLAREAAKRGVSVEALLDAEVTAKVEPVSEQEIETAYQAQKVLRQGDETRTREQIKTRLQNARLAARRRTFLESLLAQARVVIHLTAPAPFKAEVSADGSRFKGHPAAAVTVVEFQDFHCPFCKSVQPTLEQLIARYGARVKLVYRDFPIDRLHPRARKAHEAARCAHDQGKFWLYHDLLFAKAPRASPDELKTFAREAGLDLQAFERCLTSGTHQAAVQQDIDEGLRAGVTATPSFFINGRPLSGAQPLESFVRVIEEELAGAR